MSEEQIEFQKIADSFAAKELAPYAAKWEAEKMFSVDTIRAAAALGFGAMFVRPESGGSGLSRLDGSIIVESLSAGDVGTAAYITIHNMCGWMVDTFGKL